MTSESLDLLALPVGRFLDQLAAETPTPGGGAAAALGGALAAGLTSMVARYTVGRARFAEVASTVATLLTQSELLRAALAAGVVADAAAYGVLAVAYRLPLSDDAQRAARQAAIAQAARVAAQVPLDLAGHCVELLAVAERLAEVGNPQLISDVGAAAVLAEGAVRALLLNVEVNLRSVGDAAFATTVVERAASYRAQAGERRAATLQRVSTALGRQ